MRERGNDYVADGLNYVGLWGPGEDGCRKQWWWLFRCSVTEVTRYCARMVVTSRVARRVYMTVARRPGRPPPHPWVASSFALPLSHIDMAPGKVKAPAKPHGGDIRGFFSKGSSQTASGSSQSTPQPARSSVSLLVHRLICQAHPP